MLKFLQNNEKLFETVKSFTGLALGYGSMYGFYLVAARLLDLSESDKVFEGLVFLLLTSAMAKFGYDRLGLRVIGSFDRVFPRNFGQIFLKLMITPLIYSLAVLALIYILFISFPGMAKLISTDVFNNLIWLVPLFAYNHIVSQYLRGFRHPILSFIIQHGILYFIPLLLLVTGFSRNFEEVAVTFYISTGASIAVGTAVLIKDFLSREKTLKPAEFRLIFHSDLVYILMTSVLVFFYSGADIYLIKWVSETTTSSYLLSNKIALISSLGLVASNNMLAPRVSALYFEKKWSELFGEFVFAGKVASAASAFIISCLLCVLFMLQNFLGEDYTDLELFVTIFLLGQFINASVGGVNAVLQMMRKEKTVFYIQFFVILFSVPLYIVMIQNRGLTGAAIGNALSLTLWNVVAYGALLYYLREKAVISYIMVNLGIIIAIYVLTSVLKGFGINPAFLLPAVIGLFMIHFKISFVRQSAQV